MESGCNFGFALAVLKNGGRVCRSSWYAKGMWLELQQPYKGNSSMTLPFIYLRTEQEELVPWNAGHEDILAEDWMGLS